MAGSPDSSLSELTGHQLRADLTESLRLTYCERVLIMNCLRTVAMCCCCCCEACKGPRAADPRRHADND